MGQAFVLNEVYRAIQDIAFEHLSAAPPRRPYLYLRAPEGDTYVQRILELLAQAGLHPYYGEKFPSELSPTHFWVQRFRHYEKSDRDACDYLSALWAQGEPLFEFDGVRDGLYCGKVKGGRWKARYGSTSMHCHYSPFFVSGEFKKELETENFRGLVFKPVLFDKPEKVRGEFWQLTSTVTMPPCLLPVITHAGTPHDILRYDDGGYYPQELAFEEAAVRQIEPFDIALTLENLCPLPNAWPYDLVVSHRFHLVCQKLKMSSVRFIPVRLR